MKRLKRLGTVFLCVSILAGALAGCGMERASQTRAARDAITVVSREEGSGTRGAFIALMGIETGAGDMTTVEAEIANTNALVQNTVSGNRAAIGYISLGSYDPAVVKAVSVDGVEATAENIKAGTYAVSRSFHICYKEENLTDLGRDFVAFIMSADGQKIIAGKGYIAAGEAAPAYTASGLAGSLSLNGSTSVGPVMERLAEAYMNLNEGAAIDIQQTGSGTGITSTIDGSCGIGMSSRDLKDEELAQGLTSVTIALDGIAVIVNLKNPVNNLTIQQIDRVYTGEITHWSQLADERVKQGRAYHPLLFSPADFYIEKDGSHGENQGKNDAGCLSAGGLCVHCLRAADLLVPAGQRYPHHR